MSTAFEVFGGVQPYEEHQSPSPPASPLGSHNPYDIAFARRSTSISEHPNEAGFTELGLTRTISPDPSSPPPAWKRRSSMILKRQSSIISANGQTSPTSAVAPLPTTTATDGTAPASHSANIASNTVASPEKGKGLSSRFSPVPALETRPQRNTSRRPRHELQMTPSTQTSGGLTTSGETLSGESIGEIDDYAPSQLFMHANDLVMPRAAFAREGNGTYSPSSSTSSLRDMAFPPSSRRSSGYSQFGGVRSIPLQPDLSNPYTQSYERPLDTIKRLSRQVDSRFEPDPVLHNALWPAVPIVPENPLDKPPSKSRSSVSLASLGRTSRKAQSTPSSPIVRTSPTTASRKSSMASNHNAAWQMQRDFLTALAPRDGGYAIAATYAPSTGNSLSRSSSRLDVDRAYQDWQHPGGPVPINSSQHGRKPFEDVSDTPSANSSQPSLPGSTVSVSPAPTLSKTPSPLSQAVSAPPAPTEDAVLAMKPTKPSPLSRPAIDRQSTVKAAKKESTPPTGRQTPVAAKAAKAVEKDKKAERENAKKAENERENQKRAEKTRQAIAIKKKMAEDKKKRKEALEAGPKRSSSIRSALFSMPATPLKGKTKSLAAVTPASQPTTPVQTPKQIPVAKPTHQETKTVSAPAASSAPKKETTKKELKKKPSFWSIFKRFGSSKSESRANGASASMRSTPKASATAPPANAAPVTATETGPAMPPNQINGLCLHEDSHEQDSPLQMEDIGEHVDGEQHEDVANVGEPSNENAIQHALLPAPVISEFESAPPVPPRQDQTISSTSDALYPENVPLPPSTEPPAVAVLQATSYEGRE